MNFESLTIAMLVLAAGGYLFRRARRRAPRGVAGVGRSGPMCGGCTGCSLAQAAGAADRSRVAAHGTRPDHRHPKEENGCG